MSLTNLKKSKKGNFPIMLALSMITLLSFTFIKVVDHYQQVEATISESSLEILETYQIAEQLALETEVTARFIAEQVIMDLAWYPPSCEFHPCEPAVLAENIAARMQQQLLKQYPSLHFQLSILQNDNLEIVGIPLEYVGIPIPCTSTSLPQIPKSLVGIINKETGTCGMYQSKQSFHLTFPYNFKELELIREKLHGETGLIRSLQTCEQAGTLIQECLPSQLDRLDTNDLDFTLDCTDPKPGMTGRIGIICVKTLHQFVWQKKETGEIQIQPLVYRLGIKVPKFSEVINGTQ